MKKSLVIFLFALLAVFAQSCVFISEGTLTPLDPTSQTYNLRDFDQLEMGNAFDIHVRQSGQFSISVRGDRRDVQDLDVYVDRSGKLVMKYRNWRVRRYDMEVDITMPTLTEVDFSGATTSTIEGFTNGRTLDVELSGASKSVIDSDWDRINVDLSGASDLVLHGQGLTIAGELSGASRVDAFDYPVDNVDLDLSGASTARVLVGKTLRVNASGGSTLRYRGTPELRSNISGGSTVKPD